MEKSENFIYNTECLFRDPIYIETNERRSFILGHDFFFTSGCLSMLKVLSKIWGKFLSHLKPFHIHFNGDRLIQVRDTEIPCKIRTLDPDLV